MPYIVVFGLSVQKYELVFNWQNVFAGGAPAYQKSARCIPLFSPALSAEAERRIALRWAKNYVKF